MSEPRPFEIVDTPDGHRVAGNGPNTLTVFEREAKLIRRRAVRASACRPPAEAAVPLLNQLAGELLASPGMPAAEVQERLAAIARSVAPLPQQRIEWAVAELDGVRVYFDGAHVIVTREDMTP